MNKVYNTQGDISRGLFKFFNSFIKLSKPHLNNLSEILTALLDCESCITHDIAKSFKDEDILHESTITRIRRFLNNDKFVIYHFYDLFINKIISSYKVKHKDNNVHIIFDHVFIKKKWTVLVFSLRIGRTSIPLWFRSYKKIPKDAFTIDLFKNGIDYCKNLFKDKNVNLIYLGDRGFFNVDLFEYFDSINIIYCIRIKGDTIVRPTHGQHKGHTMMLENLPINQYHSKFLDNVYLSKKQYQCNIAISRTILYENNQRIEDTWYIASNGEARTSIKRYSKRFGGIETSFKNMKTNGFYLEKSLIKNEGAFRTLFGIICIALTWMVIIGADISKNKKNKYIGAVKKVNGKNIRILSLFNAGLTWFHKCYYTTNSIFKLNYHFILYDI